MTNAPQNNSTYKTYFDHNPQTSHVYFDTHTFHKNTNKH